MPRFLQSTFALLSLWCLSIASYGQKFESSNLPILIIDTKGQEVLDDPKILANIRIIDNGGKKRNKLSDRAAYAGKIGIELRGSSSQRFPKKPFGFELKDASGTKDVSASLLGLPKEEDWVLNASYNEKTLIREVLTYDIYRSFSSVYSSRHRFCEVVLNNSYEGVYILLEKIKRDQNRVNIAKLEPQMNAGDELTGGYILKIDKFTGAAAQGWVSPYLSESEQPAEIPIQVEYPKEDSLSAPQLDYIRGYVTDFEDALKSEDFRDPVSGYAKYIDVDSWANYFIINEVSHNIDGYRLSTFFYKDRDSKGGKLTMGPIWDHNLTYGNADYCNGESYRGWTFDFNKLCPGDYYQLPFWWARLLEDPAFANRVRSRYQSLRSSTLKTENLHRYIDSTATVLKEARIRNFTRWPIIGVRLWPEFYVGATYEDEVNYLKTYIARRLEWIDREIATFGTPITAIEPDVPPLEFRVFPNPAPGGRVQVAFTLERASAVKLQTYDLWGRVVQETTLGSLPPGAHQVSETLPGAGAGGQFLGLEVDGRRVVVRKVLRE